MKPQLQHYLRLWPMIAGILLSVWYFGAIVAGSAAPEGVPMLVAALGGYEIFFFGQDALVRRRRRHG